MDIKEPKTYEEQIDKLIDRGCSVANRTQAIKILKHANYYRLSAYFLPFKKSDNLTYKTGTNFEKIYNIYEFDQRIAKLFNHILQSLNVLDFACDFIDTHYFYLRDFVLGFFLNPVIIL